MTKGRDVKISYLEDTNTFVIKWINKIEFKVILGQKDNVELSYTLHKIINKEYKLGQCTFEFDKNNKLLLALNINIPDALISKNKEIIPGRVLGVDLGVKVPAMICLNDNTFIKKSIGLLEQLNKKGFDNNLLGKCGYYQLQSMIEYKAERVGRKVKYVAPAFTSQTCSKCGYVDKENRLEQEKFECRCCGFTINADHNATINIARK